MKNKALPVTPILLSLFSFSAFRINHANRQVGSQSDIADNGIASHYIQDKGIENDPDVLFAEDFEEPLDRIVARYTDVLNKEGMSLDKDVPEGSNGTSLRLTNTGGENTGGHLFRNFTPGFDSTVYLRYYVKYPSVSKGYIHHQSVWLGGYEPSLPYPSPRAGSCNIDSRLVISYEPNHNDHFDNYIYWGDMKSWNGGASCYGNVLDNPDGAKGIDWDKWTCIEVMIKLNYPVTASNGELRIWQDGKEVGYWGPGFPHGHWVKDHWIANANDPAFEGFRWRKSEGLNLNHIWIEFYDDTSPRGAKHYINYDHVVVAKKYIGPIKR